MRRLLATLVLVLSCSQATGHLDADQERRLADQGIVRRAEDLRFRHTRGAGSRWEDRQASVVVTRTTILIHRNGEVEFLFDSRSRRACEVHRDHERVRISAGSGQSAESWSFVPPDDPDAWARDLRAVVRTSRSASKGSP